MIIRGLRVFGISQERSSTKAERLHEPGDGGGLAGGGRGVHVPARMGAHRVDVGQPGLGVSERTTPLGESDGGEGGVHGVEHAGAAQGSRPGGGAQEVRLQQPTIEAEALLESLEVGIQAALEAAAPHLLAGSAGGAHAVSMLWLGMLAWALRATVPGSPNRRTKPSLCLGS